ncbi:hypothetical protein M9H77_03574 [Catharanthus roseus]|uniref:Uncharacterized protein n=1 Tax=Catharanthus roseus TaxID=4058 RepID=A0ACC0CC36_CATRO|nr:hypothetical protein M9H77_03574 [Catharanthus roseus]
MDLRKDGMKLLGLVLFLCCSAATGNVVFKVQHKYEGRGKATLSALRAHDARRHGRNLVAVDFPLGGNDKVTEAALYYTKLAIGTPPKNYHVQVDTGSDILWVNCGGCNKCPKESSLGIELKTYDIKNSKTGKQITCDQEFCSLLYDGGYANCSTGQPCEYAVTYADGSTAEGYFVADNINLDQASGNLKTTPMTGIFSFGCSAKQSGTQGTSTDRVDGIIGFGKANSSILSQLAESGKVKRVFSHCLDGDNGGIFAIGEVIEPKFQSTGLVSYENHYSIIMKKVEVGGEMMDIPTQSFFSTGRKTVIDSGATLAYLPDDVYNLVIKKVMSNHSDLKIHIVDPDLSCFDYKGNVDEGFPNITFHFKNSLSLKIYPHDYLLSIDDDGWCLGLHRGAMKTDDGEDQILLGDIILSNKLVVYDLENMTLGWTSYDCKSSIKVKDEGSGNVFSISAHNISPPTPTSSSSSAHRFFIGRKLLLTFFFFFFFFLSSLTM